MLFPFFAFHNTIHTALSILISRFIHCNYTILWPRTRWAHLYICLATFILLTFLLFLPRLVSASILQSHSSEQDYHFSLCWKVYKILLFSFELAQQSFLWTSMACSLLPGIKVSSRSQRLVGEREESAKVHFFEHPSPFSSVPQGEDQMKNKVIAF